MQTSAGMIYFVIVPHCFGYRCLIQVQEIPRVHPLVRGLNLLCGFTFSGYVMGVEWKIFVYKVKYTLGFTHTYSVKCYSLKCDSVLKLTVQENVHLVA